MEDRRRKYLINWPYQPKHCPSYLCRLFFFQLIRNESTEVGMIHEVDSEHLKASKMRVANNESSGRFLENSPNIGINDFCNGI